MHNYKWLCHNICQMGPSLVISQLQTYLSNDNILWKVVTVLIHLSFTINVQKLHTFLRKGTQNSVHYKRVLTLSGFTISDIKFMYLGLRSWETVHFKRGFTISGFTLSGFMCNNTVLRNIIKIMFIIDDQEAKSRVMERVVYPRSHWLKSHFKEPAVRTSMTCH